MKKATAETNHSCVSWMREKAEPWTVVEITGWDGL